MPEGGLIVLHLLSCLKLDGVALYEVKLVSEHVLRVVVGPTSDYIALLFPLPGTWLIGAFDLAIDHRVSALLRGFILHERGA